MTSIVPENVTMVIPKQNTDSKKEGRKLKSSMKGTVRMMLVSKSRTVCPP